MLHRIETTASFNAEKGGTMADGQRYPIPNKINLLVILLQLALAGGIFWGAARAEAWWQLALLSLAFSVVGTGASPSRCSSGASPRSLLRERDVRRAGTGHKMDDVQSIEQPLRKRARGDSIEERHCGP